MTELGDAGIRGALEGVRSMATRLFEVILEPYEALAAAAPDAAIGDPVPVPHHAPSGQLSSIVETLQHRGRSGWALSQVQEREQQVLDFTQDYRAGLFAETGAADWVGRVRAFREAVLADVNTALQAPRGWDRLDLNNGVKAATVSELLTPKDVAPEVGLGERAVRRRIQEGRLGPWRKDGSRWVISRDAFYAYFAEALLESDSDIPQPPQPLHSQDEVEDRLLHVKLRPDAST